MLDQFAEFARMLPAWCGKDGMPLSWRHFRAGMDHIVRAAAQEELRMTEAMRLSQTVDDTAWIKYLNRLRCVAGFTR